MADQLGDHVLGAAQQRRRAVAVVEFVGRRDARHALVRRRHQRWRSVLGGVEAGDQCRGARLQRTADVGGRQVLLDVERGADDAGVLAILEGMRGRGEVDVAHVGSVVAGQAVARCLDRHGDRILVPVGHRALALGEAAQAGGEPLVGVVDGLTVEAQARDIGSEGHDSDHSCLSSVCPAGARRLMNARLFALSAPAGTVRAGFRHGRFQRGTIFRSAEPRPAVPASRAPGCDSRRRPGCAGSACRPCSRPKAGR